jgi:hypothetical protein
MSIESSKDVVAEVPVEELAVGLSRWRTDMFWRTDIGKAKRLSNR